MGLFLDEEVTPLVVICVPFLGGLVALGMISVLLARVRAAPAGVGPQLLVADRIAAGAASFLVAECTYLAAFVGGAAVFLVAVLEAQGDRSPVASYSTHPGGWQTMMCFLTGAGLSAAAGWAGVKVATETNVKTMEAAAKSGVDQALSVAFTGGACFGFYVVAFGLLGISFLFYVFAVSQSGEGAEDMRDAVRYLSGFAFGASSVALFARVAGGIYVKAADAGAALVGKLGDGSPDMLRPGQGPGKDDPCNANHPAAVAHHVGDAVGDVAGVGADLFESYVGSIIACAALAGDTREICLPFWIAGFGIVAAAIGFWTVTAREEDTSSQLLHALHRATYSAAALMVLASIIAVQVLFDGTRQGWKHFTCIIIGLVAGVLIGEATEYFTASRTYDPVRRYISQKAGATGAGGAAAAERILQGLGVGTISVFLPGAIIVFTILTTYWIGGEYGIALSAVGMLSTLGVTLATDAYSPIADNARGIAEMAASPGGCPPKLRAVTDKLRALGNTTAAAGKGFAVGAAVLTALSLFNAYVAGVPVSCVRDGGVVLIDRCLTDSMQPSDPSVVVGFILGATLPVAFAALTVLSARRAVGAVTAEVQRQLHAEIPGVLEGGEGVVVSDHVACVRLCTASSTREMFLPGVLAVFTPVSIGLLFGAKCLGGLLAGAIASGLMLAVMISNAGGAWGSGNPFKETSGPALNILIKLMAAFSLVLAPVFRDVWDTWWQGFIVLLVQLILAGGYCARYHYHLWGPVITVDTADADQTPLAIIPPTADADTS